MIKAELIASLGRVPDDAPIYIHIHRHFKLGDNANGSVYPIARASEDEGHGLLLIGDERIPEL
jgi:hypothetical protein